MDNPDQGWLARLRENRCVPCPCEQRL